MGDGTIGRPIVPKEHGAWAVLYGAFLAGVGVAGRLTVPVMLLFGAVTLLAFANGPLVLLLRPTGGPVPSTERRRAFAWMAIYAAGAAACLAPLLVVFQMTFLFPSRWRRRASSCLRAFFVRQGDDRSLPGELVGAAALTLVGPIAHAVAVNGAQPVGAVLWLLLILFFASGVFYVRMRIRVMLAQRRGVPAVSSRARWSCVVFHAFLLVLMPGLAAVQSHPLGGPPGVRPRALAGGRRSAAAGRHAQPQAAGLVRGRTHGRLRPAPHRLPLIADEHVSDGAARDPAGCLAQ